MGEPLLVVVRSICWRYADDRRPLAEQLTRTAPTPREKTEQIERFFRNNFEYSLTTNLSGQEHPLVVLIKERRPAYCIYYASAMAVM